MGQCRAGEYPVLIATAGVYGAGWVSVRRNYWVYSIGLAIVWAVILGVVAIGTHKSSLHTFLFVFAGFVIAWVSGTIARYVYPPPTKWSR